MIQYLLYLCSTGMAGPDFIVVYSGLLTLSTTMICNSIVLIPFIVYVQSSMTYGVSLKSVRICYNTITHLARDIHYTR